VAIAIVGYRDRRASFRALHKLSFIVTDEPMYRHLDVALRALVRNYDDIPDAFETEAASSVTNCGFWTCGARIPLRFRSFRRGRERPADPIVGASSLFCASWRPQTLTPNLSSSQERPIEDN